MTPRDRTVHPGAWWLWALGLAAAATRTTNPLLLALLVAVASVVVAGRRSDGPWGRAFRGYLLLGAVVVVIRVVFRALLAGGGGGTLLLQLPELTLPSWLTGIVVGGRVTLEAVLAGAYDGSRLATIIICVGAANALANPKRLLRAVPGALYEVGAVLVVSATILPQLAHSVGRVRRARRLRGSDPRGIAGLRSLVVPVLEDAFERSLRLAAAMDSRGYGRTSGIPRAQRRLTGVLVLGGLMALAIGTYGLLDPTGVGGLGVPFLVGGSGAALAGLWSGSRRVAATRYRPDPWGPREWIVALTGVGVATSVFLAAELSPAALAPSLSPLVWPALPPLAAVGILAGLSPLGLSSQGARSAPAVAST